VKPFASAGAALSWAATEAEGWIFGRAMSMQPKASCSTDGYQAHVLALSILMIAGRHDVFDRHGDSCFYAWYIKEAHEATFNAYDLERLRKARRALEAELIGEGIILLAS